MQFGRNHRFGDQGVGGPDERFDTLLERLYDDLTELKRSYQLSPDLIALTGDLAEWGLKREFSSVQKFAEELCTRLRVPSDRILVVPGNHDINRKKCNAYFLDCEGDDKDPIEPFWPKWTPFVEFFDDLYRDVERYRFTENEPWTLYELPELQVVVAGLNSTMRESHRDSDHYGWLGERQLRWFSERLLSYRNKGWLRIGLVHHNPIRGATGDDENLRDANDLRRHLGDCLNLLLHGHTHLSRDEMLGALPVLSTGSAALRSQQRPDEVPNQYQIIRVTEKCIHCYARQYETQKNRWIGDTRVSDRGDSWHFERELALSQAHATFSQRLVSGELPAEASLKVNNEASLTAPARTFREDITVTAALTGPLCKAAAESCLRAEPASPHGWGTLIARSSIWRECEGDANVARWKCATATVASEWEVLWNSAFAGAAEIDPWLDRGYVARVLSRLEELCRDEPMNAPAVAHMVLAPLGRDVVLARTRAALWKVADSTTDASRTGMDVETLRMAIRAHPSLERRLSDVDQEHVRPVMSWLIHDAARRHPQLWRPDGQFVQPVSQAARKALGALTGAQVPWGGRSLEVLSTLVSADPSALEREGGLLEKPHEAVAGITLDLLPLAWRVMLASAMALDLDRCDIAAVTSLGRDPDWAPRLLLEAVAALNWQDRGSVRQAVLECAHPVQHFVLTELVRNADGILSQAQQQGVAEVTHRWPTRLDFHELKPCQLNYGSPAFVLPHVRFRLDHERVRDLLIGEQLYGRPELAFRELYQNALDACRYRRARHSYIESRGDGWRVEGWVGRIEFREFEVDGRVVVECRDNGIGMDRYTLAQVFSVGGMRFCESDEYREERAAWSSLPQPVQLYPNSRFGIGVLSYFMIAEEIEIRTRRLRRNGAFGQYIRAHITSASGLFRIEEGDSLVSEGEPWPDNCGTIIRLIGARTSRTVNGIVHTSMSCLATLEQLLVVSEFETSAQEDGTFVRWSPGEPRGGASRKFVRIPFHRENGMELWFCNSKEGGLLVDGLTVRPFRDSTEHLLVNLKGVDAPSLEVNRNLVIGPWNESLVIEAISTQASCLVGWTDLSLILLWWLENRAPDTCRKVVEAAIAKSQNVHLHPWLPRDAPLSEVGCFRADMSLAWTGIERSERARPMLAIHWTLYSVAAWRREVWRSILQPGTSVLRSCFASLRSLPGDSALLGFATERGQSLSEEWSDERPGLRRVIWPHMLPRRAHAASMTLSEAVRRLHALSDLGVRVLGEDLANEPDQSFSPDFLTLIDRCTPDVDSGKRCTTRTIIAWLVESELHAPEALATYLVMLPRFGVQVNVPVNVEVLRGLALDTLDRTILGMLGPTKEVPALALLALTSVAPPAELEQRLTRLQVLGLRFPAGVRIRSLPTVDAKLATFLRVNFDSQPRLVQGPIGILRLLQTSFVAGLSVAETAEQLKRFNEVAYILGPEICVDPQFDADTWQYLRLILAPSRPIRLPAAEELDPAWMFHVLSDWRVAGGAEKFVKVIRLLKQYGLIVQDWLDLDLIPRAWSVVGDFAPRILMERTSAGRFCAQFDWWKSILLREDVDADEICASLAAFGVSVPSVRPDCSLETLQVLRAAGIGWRLLELTEQGKVYISAGSLGRALSRVGSSERISRFRKLCDLQQTHGVILPMPDQAQCESWCTSERAFDLLVASLVAAEDVSSYPAGDPWEELRHALRWYAWWASSGERESAVVRLRSEGWLESSLLSERRRPAISFEDSDESGR